MKKIQIIFIMLLLPVLAMAQFTGGNGRGDYSLGYSPCSNAIEVMNAGDDGAGSLRQAIANLCSGGTITFNASLDADTITLSSGELLIDKGLTIDASALTNGIIVDGNDVSRIFNINCSAASDITIKNLALTNGASIANGAGIYMSTSNITLVLVDVDLNYCNADNGGAIFQNGGSLDISGAAFESNTAKNGGAIYSTNSSICSLVNCFINANLATVSGGGGFWIHDGCQLTLTNCLMHDNSSPVWGGGIVILPNATATLTNCTLSQNASGLGGGLYNSGGTFVINNSILWGNTSTQWGNQIETTSGISTTLNYSCFANVYDDATGVYDIEGPVTNNSSITTSPGFVNPGADDFRVRGNSPCVNSGENSYNAETSDIRGKTRIQITTIDMGAYEWTTVTDPAYENIFVNYDATTGSNNGTDWTNAFVSLQSALDKDLNTGDKIWVAKGTYYPSSNYGLDAGNERFKHFRMNEGVSIFGSLAGTEDVLTYDLTLRDFETNKTILSGNIGSPGDSTDNCYHIFYHPDGLGLTSSALLDGFEIREAVANYEVDFKDGAGMFNANNSPALANCLFTENYSSDRGGAVYNSGSSPSFNRVRFTGNRAGTDGGAVFNNENSDPAFSSCAFDQNYAQYSGGGIYSKENSNPTLTNCLLVYNTAIYGGASFNQSPVTFVNCTFANNYAYQGGGLCNEGDAEIKNCIISGNDGVVGKQIFIKESTTSDINYSDYSDETDDVSNSGSMTGDNNINTDPLFIDSETGDFRIFGNSPCADAGNDADCNESNDIRGVGFPRKLDKTNGITGTIDMGAFEFLFNSDPYFPTISITSPTDGSSIYSNPVTISGTAADGDGDLSLVEVKLNGGTWQTATGTDNWTIDLDLVAGKNTIFARAKDATDLYSDTASIKVLLSIQIINIPQGWSAISSYLKPLDPDLPMMMDEITSNQNLVIMLSENGIYWPPYNTNTIGSWKAEKGYKVKMTTAQEFTVRGDTLVSRSINLTKGYHIIPVLSNVSCPVSSVFADPLNDILFMFDVKTNALYWPQGEIFSLTSLLPGKGYIASFNKAVTLTYPAYSGLKSGIMTYNTEPEMNGPWALVRTADVHFVSINGRAVNNLENADFIGAFDSFGICLGYAEVDGRSGNYLLTIFGNDETTDFKDGGEAGEPISFRAFNSSTSEETTLIAEFNTSFPNADGLFVSNGMSEIIRFKESATGIGETGIVCDIQVYPNPAKDVVNINLTTPKAWVGFKATLISAEGKVVNTFTISGIQTILNVQDLQPGIYILKFENAENVVIKRLVIQ